MIKRYGFASVLAFILTIMVGHISFGQEASQKLQAKFLIEGGIEFGGDEIVTVFFQNGEDQTMRAGQGGYLMVGGQFQFSDVEKFMLRAGIGYKYTTTAANDANIKFTRIPINLTAFYVPMKDLRFGLGLASHQAVKFDGDGFISDVKFKSALGPRLEIGYSWFAVTYTLMDYKTPNGAKVSANAIGLNFSFVLPSH